MGHHFGYISTDFDRIPKILGPVSKLGPRLQIGREIAIIRAIAIAQSGHRSGVSKKANFYTPAQIDLVFGYVIALNEFYRLAPSDPSDCQGYSVRDSDREWNRPRSGLTRQLVLDVLKWIWGFRIWATN